MDLDLALLDGARRLGAANSQLDLGQALDAAALDTDKVRVVVVAVVRLEPPGVIANIGAPDEADLGEVRQVPIDRRAVPRRRRQAIRHVAMRHRHVGKPQQFEYCEPRWRRTQTLRANVLLQLSTSVRFCVRAMGHDGRAYRIRV